jgi:hypothetical protein
MVDRPVGSVKDSGSDLSHNNFMQQVKDQDQRIQNYPYLQYQSNMSNNTQPVCATCTNCLTC